MSMRNLLVVMGSAIALAGACIDPRCPKNYDQRGDTCYRKRDAGEDASAVDGGTDAEPQVGAEDAEPDGISAPDDAAAENDALPAACNAECAEDEVCERADGVATCACAPGRDACEAGCVDLSSDPSNCGSCGYRCETGPSCEDGKCEQKIRELVLGGNSSCALYDSPDGRYPVKCWGDTSNKLFRDAATQALSPRSVVGVPSARALAVDGNRQCAVLPDRDAVRCWGYCDQRCGSSGAFGLSDVFYDSIVGAVLDVHVGDTATCSRTGLGLISCWGAAVMIASETDRVTPSATTVAGQSMLTDLSVGGSHACALTQDQRVVCWGSPSFLVVGEEIDATLARTGAFVRTETGIELSDVRQVYAGKLRNCALTDQGVLWCWGDNGAGMIGPLPSGSLGTGDRSKHTGAAQIALLDVSHVAIGWWHACAVVGSGQVYCWGTAPFIGRGAGAPAADAEGLVTTPQPVSGLDDVVELKAGDGHTCARRRSGQIVCWGANEQGQLGDGTTVARLSPTPVVNLY